MSLPLTNETIMSLQLSNELIPCEFMNSNKNNKS